jgi:hypothetical protein
MDLLGRAARRRKRMRTVELQLFADQRRSGAGVIIRLPGETVRAGLAFDTRPSRGMGRHGLTQLFLGQEIETEEAVFDPGAAMLMDFRCPQSGAPHFTYVLPTSPRRALVEDTWREPVFSRRTIAPLFAITWRGAMASRGSTYVSKSAARCRWTLHFRPVEEGA